MKKNFINLCFIASAILTCALLTSCESDEDKASTGASNGGVSAINEATPHVSINEKGEYSMSGVKAVDLGLSVKWASCNIGAENPEETGDYFAWGETKGYYKEHFTFANKDCSWTTYALCEGTLHNLKKYNVDASYGNVDIQLTPEELAHAEVNLKLGDDAAYVNWGSDWRMPTRAELIELIDNCDWTLTTVNNVSGYNVSSRKNGNSIFLPAAGCICGHNVGSGLYWSSTLLNNKPGNAYTIYYNSGGLNRDSFYFRYDGMPVRPVLRNPSEKI